MPGGRPGEGVRSLEGAGYIGLNVSGAGGRGGASSLRLGGSIGPGGGGPETRLGLGLMTSRGGS